MTTSRAPLSVLMVEDDALWRRIIRHTLNKHNVRLVDASSVAEALVALDNDGFDVVFIDYELPDGCGLDILDSVERERLGRLVLASGFVDPEDLHDDRASQVDRFLTKPFLSADLGACLEDLAPAEATNWTLRRVI